MWSPCCANRVTVQLDPLNASNTGVRRFRQRYRYAKRHGDRHEHGLSQHHHALRRPASAQRQTVWLAVSDGTCSGGTGGCCCQNPVIYGGGLPGDPVVTGGTAAGLTTRWLYDDNLSLSGSGLVAGVQVSSMKTSGSFTVSVAGLLSVASSSLSSSAGSLFTSGGSAAAAPWSRSTRGRNLRHHPRRPGPDHRHRHSPARLGRHAHHLAIDAVRRPANSFRGTPTSRPPATRRPAARPRG